MRGKVVKAPQSSEGWGGAGDWRGREMGLGDMFKRVRRRRIRGGVERERASDNEREKGRAVGRGVRR